MAREKICELESAEAVDAEKVQLGAQIASKYLQKMRALKEQGADRSTLLAEHQRLLNELNIANGNEWLLSAAGR
jgi:hypothetical protein